LAGRGEQQQDWPMRVKRPGEGRNQSRSATRALDVLELFGQKRGPLRAVEIARTLGLHPSTTNQLLKTMVESAHLTFDAKAKIYSPSPRLALFGGWIVQSYGGDARLRRLIEQVQAQSGEFVTLTTPNDMFMQVVDFAGGDQGAAAAQRGLRVSMFGSAIGAAYLSSLADDEILRLAYRARLPESENSALLSWIAHVRQDGFADGPSVGGTIWSIAAPLPLRGQNASLVVGLAGPAERVKAKLGELGELLRAMMEKLEG
jgi:DNA-binding IclR family transcriptional regulator